MLRRHGRSGKHALDHVGHERSSLGVGYDASNNSSAALYRAPNRLLIDCPASGASPFVGALVLFFPAHVHFAGFDFPCQIANVLFKQSTNLFEHAIGGFVGNAKLPLKLFGRDTASGACDQVHRVEPEMKRRGRFMKNRSRSRVQMMAARGACPRLPLLCHRIALEGPNYGALRAKRVGPIRRTSVAPQLLQASLIAAIFPHELHQRVARLGRCSARS